ncbi:MAG: rhomboid family intramembrane serine protease [Proteobacteria bacterium]|nr:rhomboid family intramembrane serine protease [Pseudomonadota bacterium]
MNAAVFAYQATLGEAAGNAFVLGYGMIPAVLGGTAELPADLPTLAPWMTIVTSMFLHGGFMHVAGNMLYLWTFGNNVEDAMGRGRFAVFYLACGFAAALSQAFVDFSSEMPMIGASGAVSGVLAGYLLLHPHASVYSFAFFRLAWIPAWFVLGFWIVVQVANGMLADAGEGGVAWWAHVGGFAAGLVLLPFFKRADVPLFGGRTRSGPWG